MKIHWKRIIGGSLVAIAIAVCFCLTDFKDPVEIVKTVAMTSFYIVFCIIDYLTAKSRYSGDHWRWARIFSAESESSSSWKIQFSLMQMLIATAVVAVVFSVFAMTITFKVSATILPASVVALALGGLVLIAKRCEAKAILGLVVLYFATTFILGLAVLLVFGLTFWFCGR